MGGQVPETSGAASGRGTQFGQLGHGDKEEGVVAAQGLSCDQTSETSLGYHGRPLSSLAFNGSDAAPCQGSNTAAMGDNAVEETNSETPCLDLGFGVGFGVGKKKHVGNQ